jgi:hypothetical protein
VSCGLFEAVQFFEGIGIEEGTGVDIGCVKIPIRTGVRPDLQLYDNSSPFWLRPGKQGYKRRGGAEVGWTDQGDVTCILTVGAHAAFVPRRTSMEIVVPESENSRPFPHFFSNNSAVRGRLSAEDWFFDSIFVNVSALRS